MVEARLFALDASGNIIGSTVSSDRTTVIWTDLLWFYKVIEVPSKKTLLYYFVYNFYVSLLN